MTARLVGALFITATVTSGLGIVIFSSILDAPDFLTNFSANEDQVIMAALLMLIYTVAAIGIAVLLYPILRRLNEALALGYAAARIVESVLFIVYVVILLSLLTLSHEFVRAGAPDAGSFQAGGALLRAASGWALSLGLRLAFALSALILNYLLFKSKLVPRWLSGWGFAGATFVLALLLLELFSIQPVEVLDLPMAVQEMVFAVWLIVKGFDPNAVVTEYES
jgi:hypothetical protein